MRNSPRSILPCFVLAAVASIAAPASAQKAKKAATEAFKACREQEKFGEATSCWRAWLEKHKSAAQEAEVLYAEEKVKQGESAKEEPEPESKAAASEAEGAAPAAPAEKEGTEAGESAEAEASLEDLSDDDGAPAKPGIGLSVILHGTAALFIMNEGEHRFALSPTQAATYNVPGFGYGGGLSVGYSLAKLLKMQHTHVRVGAERLVGTGDGTSVAVTNAELVFEKGFALGSKLIVYVALGPSLTIGQVNVVPAEVPVPNQTDRTQEISTTRFGGTARVGLELPLSARLFARLEVAGRVNTKGFYEPADGNVIFWDFEKRKDSFSSVGGRLGVGVTF
jgi:hypothetical protein